MKAERNSSRFKSFHTLQMHRTVDKAEKLSHVLLGYLKVGRPFRNRQSLQSADNVVGILAAVRSLTTGG
jgi:hypothetical protein